VTSRAREGLFLQMGVELSTPQTTAKKMIKKVLPTRGNPLSLLHADLNQIVVVCGCQLKVINFIRAIRSSLPSSRSTGPSEIRLRDSRFGFNANAQPGQPL